MARIGNTEPEIEPGGFVPCARARIGRDGVRSPNWGPLIAALRNDVAARARLRFGGRAGLAMPFRDVVILGPAGDHIRRAASAREALEAEFAEQGVDFRTVSCDTRSPDGLFAFFGAGVHAPSGGESPVADISFSWTAPTAGAIPEAAIQRPELEAGRPAALYAEQLGLALGFANDACPAALDLAAAGGGETARRLPETFLFIGRQDEHSPPVVRLFPRPGVGPLACVAVAEHGDWRRREGEWQKVSLRVDFQNELPLWFRIAGRIGDSVFFDPERARKAPTPRLRVHGLIVPELRFWTFSTGNPSRWTVAFDSAGRLRAGELAEFGVTIVAETLRPFGVFDQAQASWRAFGYPGHQLTEIAGSRSIGVFDFDGNGFRGHPGVIKAMSLYDGWALLRAFDGEPLGEFTLPRGESAVRAGPIVPELARGSALSLDWLNRCATVRVGGRDIGLARYWSDRVDAEIRVRADPRSLEIAVVNARGRGVKPFAVASGGGELGALGPLLVSYMGWDET